MDFTNREVRHTQPHAATPGSHSVPDAPAPNNDKKNKTSMDSDHLGRVITVLLVSAIVILLGGAIALTASRNSDKEEAAKTSAILNESSYVDDKKLQAVFLNTGQVYFGNIETMNSRFLVLSNIYYLQTAGGTGANAAANANVTLVKLGCELHEPDDQMVINRTQVTFWENLHDSGQVAKAVAAFKKQNPDGQKCADQSTSASNNSSNSVQNAKPNN